MDETNDEQNETAETEAPGIAPEPSVDGPGIDQEPEPEETPADDSGAAESHQEAEPETFPADVVHKLRDEAARYRTKAKDRDDLAQELFTAKVAATGRLADPTDLPYDERLLNDHAALDQAVGELIHAKPHLASRRPTGSVGQGPRSADAGAVDIASMLRARAS